MNHRRLRCSASDVALLVLRRRASEPRASPCSVVVGLRRLHTAARQGTAHRCSSIAGAPAPRRSIHVERAGPPDHGARVRSRRLPALIRAGRGIELAEPASYVAAGRVRSRTGVVPPISTTPARLGSAPADARGNSRTVNLQPTYSNAARDPRQQDVRRGASPAGAARVSRVGIPSSRRNGAPAES